MSYDFMGVEVSPESITKRLFSLGWKFNKRNPEYAEFTKDIGEKTHVVYVPQQFWRDDYDADLIAMAISFTFADDHLLSSAYEKLFGVTYYEERPSRKSKTGKRRYRHSKDDGKKEVRLGYIPPILFEDGQKYQRKSEKAWVSDTGIRGSIKCFSGGHSSY